MTLSLRLPFNAIAMAATAIFSVATSAAPMPDGGGDLVQIPKPVVYTSPLYGVPEFSPPKATSCPADAKTFGTPGLGAGGQVLREDVAVMSAPGGGRDRVAVSGSVMKRAPKPVAVYAEAPPPPPAAAAPALQKGGGNEPVKAGFVDDNADFGEYQAYLQRNAQLQGYRPRDVSERYRVLVRNGEGKPVANALVSATLGQETVVWARTDQKGQVWFAPNAVFNPKLRDQDLLISARLGDKAGSAPLVRGQKQGVTLQLNTPVEATTGLDLVFIVDATGSMSAEIDKLRRSLSTIADRINKLPNRPNLCLGMVAYRDKYDEFLIKGLHLTANVANLQKELNGLSAAGGGDRPEALNEALKETVHKLQWRGGNTTRVAILVADAEPHMDYGGPYYDETAAAALAKGIRLHAVGASGLSKEGEFVFRQLAQYTGGKFVFLTYRDAAAPEQGAGDQTVHDVKNYSVDTLDDLIVRLIQDDLAH